MAQVQDDLGLLLLTGTVTQVTDMITIQAEILACVTNPALDAPMFYIDGEVHELTPVATSDPDASKLWFEDLNGVVKAVKRIGWWYGIELWNYLWGTVSSDSENLTNIFDSAGSEDP